MNKFTIEGFNQAWNDQDGLTSDELKDLGLNKPQAEGLQKVLADNWLDADDYRELSPLFKGHEDILDSIKQKGIVNRARHFLDYGRFDELKKMMPYGDLDQGDPNMSAEDFVESLVRNLRSDSDPSHNRIVLGILGKMPKQMTPEQKLEVGSVLLDFANIKSEGMKIDLHELQGTAISIATGFDLPPEILYPKVANLIHSSSVAVALSAMQAIPRTGALGYASYDTIAAIVKDPGVRTPSKCFNVDDLRKSAINALASMQTRQSETVALLIDEHKKVFSEISGVSNVSLSIVFALTELARHSDEIRAQLAHDKGHFTAVRDSISPEDDMPKRQRYNTLLSWLK
jgi:hypothetical protein